MNAGRTRPNVARTPTTVRRLAVAGVAATFVASVIAIGASATTSSSGLQQIVTTDLLKEEPLAKFAKLMPVVGHPRCVNCHGGSNPFEGINHPPKVMLPAVAARLRDANGDHDFAAQGSDVCNTCHDAKEVNWVLAHKFSSFLDQSARQICSLWKTSLHDSARDLLDHLQGDALIQVAFDGNKNVDDPSVLIQKPRMDFNQFFALAKEWLDSGTGDIPCTGWAGTITQTERVNLTTTHSTTMPGLRESTTETQNATRTVTITVVGGTVDFRIAVKGTQRIDSTVEAGSGREACTSLQYTHRVYETENGETVGPAEIATLVFLPRGAYALTFRGPREKTVRVERTGGTLCQLGPVPDDSDTLKFDNNPWTLSFDGVLPNPADRTVLKGSQTKKVINADAWLTHLSGAAVAPLQVRDNGEMLNVEVEVTTTWDLQRRD